ncbi:MAG: DUF4136 domain-containing protein [Elusimicrobiales bacterium]|nr:DUF4136 domain-containing protein [Elusimicrobiales bacterium]
MKKIIFITIIISITSCTSFKNLSKIPKIDKASNFAVLTFINNSETPSSGLKIKNIIENELFTKGYNIVFLNSDSETDNITEQEIYNKIEEMKSKARYFVFGYVNEWRYKSGIDFEPAVSITLNIYDSKDNSIIWSGRISQNASSYSSTSQIASKAVKKLLKNF